MEVLLTTKFNTKCSFIEYSSHGQTGRWTVELICVGNLQEQPNKTVDDSVSNTIQLNT
jgi:hypothetical protein